MVLVEELSSRNVKPKANSDSNTKNSGLLQTGVFSCAYATLMQTDTYYQKQTKLNKPQKTWILRLPSTGEGRYYFYYAAFALLFFLVCYFGAYSIAQLHDYRIAIPETGGQYLSFHPAWSLAYISIYFAKGLTPFAVRSRQECLAWSRSLCYSVSLATIVFVLFPTEQPPVEHLRALEGNWMDLYWATSAASTSGNAFPSLHVASMMCTTWYCTQQKPRWFTSLIYLWMLAIVYSTVVLRLHYLVDIAGGLIVGWIAIAVSRKKLHLAEQKGKAH